MVNTDKGHFSLSQVTSLIYCQPHFTRDVTHGLFSLIHSLTNYGLISDIVLSTLRVIIYISMG